MLFGEAMAHKNNIFSLELVSGSGTICIFCWTEKRCQLDTLKDFLCQMPYSLCPEVGGGGGGGGDMLKVQIDPYIA